MKNIISIDPSLSSTAIVVRNSHYQYFSFFKDFKENNKWCKDLSPFVQFSVLNKFLSVEDFSENEMLKFNQYLELAKNIETVLLPYLSNAEIRIESYSQGSKNGKFQDLITFGTLLRYRLLRHCPHITSVPPKQLKKEAAKLVYMPDKKGIIRNKDGKAAGSFNKWDMFQTLIDSNIHNELATYCQKRYKLITANKNVPKPIEDLIDALFLNLI